ncbi:MAG: DMT family transporter [Armatimonadetes bacterium]|nr:DMT family transporter [Armatimonadota bacterium]
MRRFSPNPYLVATVGLWALNFIAVKFVFAELAPSAATLLRTILVGLVFVVVVKLRRESLRFPDVAYRNRIVFQGFVSLGVYMVVFMEGMQRAKSSDAAIIMALSPLLTGIFSVLLKQESYRPRIFVGAGIAFLGIFAVFAYQDHDPTQYLGNGLILLAAIIWAFGVILMRPLLSQASPFVLVTQSLLGASLCVIPYGFRAVLTMEWSSVSLSTWLWLTYAAVLSGGVAFITFYKGIHQIGAGRAALYQYMTPPLTVVLSYFLLGSGFHWSQALGIILVIGGVVYGNRVSNEVESQKIIEA